jgi:hypothetical protein
MSETKARYDATPADLRDYAPRILSILQRHVGRANAITADDLAMRLNIKGANANRRVRMIIARMVLNNGEFIGSSPHEPRGFWLIDNRDEAREVLLNWRNRSLSLMRRYKRIAELAYRKFGIPIEQLKLEI